MHKVRADTEKNRLYIHLIGAVDTKSAEEITDSILAETSKMKPGFNVITDLTQYKPGHLAAVKSLLQGM